VHNAFHSIERVKAGERIPPNNADQITCSTNVQNEFHP
jgi:hypothetical protein